MTGVSLLERINGLMQAERWRQAIELCMSERPEALTADVLWNWAWAHFKLGQFTASKGLFERALELQPEAPLMLWGLGVTLRELGDLDEAKRRFRRALGLKDSAMVRQDLALVLMKEGDLTAAEEVHLEGLRFKPGSRERTEAYADFLSDCGREDEAALHYARAKGMGLGREEPR
jgi:tetratricopeptide (TPR) repeat protein